jgi:hypothetical protein
MDAYAYIAHGHVFANSQTGPYGGLIVWKDASKPVQLPFLNWVPDLR